MKTFGKILFVLVASYLVGVLIMFSLNLVTYLAHGDFLDWKLILAGGLLTFTIVLIATLGIHIAKRFEPR